MALFALLDVLRGFTVNHLILNFKYELQKWILILIFGCPQAQIGFKESNLGLKYTSPNFSKGIILACK